MVQFVEPDGLSADLLRELDRPPVRAVRDIHRGQVFCRKCLGHEKSHLAAADHKDMPALKRPELGLGKQDGGRADRDGAPVDLRAFPYPDSHVDGLVDAEFEKTARGAGFLCIGKRLLELPDDLVFADDHRLDAGSKREEVAERVAAFEQEKSRPALSFEEVPERPGIAFDNHLDPVAGLEEEHATEISSPRLQGIPVRPRTGSFRAR